MTVVADSSPLIFLAAVSQFALLRLYFSSLLIPTAVHREVIEAGDERPGARETRKALEAGWIETADPADEQRISSLLKRGMTWADAHVVALGVEQQADLIVSDDGNVRAQAQTLDLAVVGTIGILLNARRDGHLSSLRAMLDQLIATGFYLRPGGSVYQTLLQRAGEA